MIEGDLPPIESAGMKRPVVRVKPGERLRALLLGDLVGRYCHFADGRTRPCPGQGCSLCREQARRWYGWVPAFVSKLIARSRTGKDVDHWRCEPASEAVLEFTEGAYAAIATDDLRGLLIDLWRPAASARSPVRVEFVSDEVERPVVLPESFDVKPILGRLWGLPDAFGTPPSRDGVAGHVEMERKRRAAGERG